MSAEERQNGGENSPMDRRDRLEYPSCEDEPVNPDPAVQDVLNAAYRLKDTGRITEVYPLLEQSSLLPKLPYQEVRFENLFGEYYVAIDREPDKQVAFDRDPAQDFLGKAADHYARGAAIARDMDIPDMALFAQLKRREAKVCFFSHPRYKRYGRAFMMAKEALDAWISLADRQNTPDMLYGFELGDALGVYGQIVAQDGEAVRGLDYAARKLFEQLDRPDFNSTRYANDELFLDWDWTSLYYTMSHYRHAFQAALRTRRKDRDLFTAQNRARFQCLIASIMLACAEEGGVGDFSYNRLMAASDKALDEAYGWVEKGKKEGKEDRATFAMIRLAEAKWMGMSKNPRIPPEDRIAKIEEAQRIATERNDILLLGQVEIAWGDEYAFQNTAHPTRQRKDAAEQHYRNAIAMVEDVEALSLVRIARRRLERLKNPPKKGNQGNQGGNSPRKPTNPPAGFDPTQN